jgi:hypothetical protein
MTSISPPQLRSWRFRKRVWLPLLSLLVLAGALALAVARSDTSKIIVYNETVAPIGALKIIACGQQTVLRNLAEKESFRWKLAKTGSPGEIEIETASNPPWRWQGGYIEPRCGYRVTLRLRPDGAVEMHTQISIWQRLFRGAPNIDD